MNFKYQQFVIGMISTTILLSTIMLLGYVHTRTSSRSGRPFDMSNNYVHLMTDGKSVAVDLAIDLQQDKEVLIVSTDGNDASYIGIYDPMLVNADMNLYSIVGVTRYFSYIDYTNKSRSGIIVDDNLATQYTRCKNMTNDRIDDVIFCMDSNNSLTSGTQINEIINLTSLKTMGRHVYIDSTQPESMDPVINRLLSFGYEQVAKEEIGLFSSLIIVFTTDFVSLLLSVGVLILYVLFGYVLFFYFYNNRKELSLHVIHGGTLTQTMFHFLKQMIVTYVVSFLLSLVFFQNKYITINFKTLMSIFLFHVVLTSLIYMINFTISFLSIQKEKRLFEYVH